MLVEGGNPVQRQRVDDYMERVAREDFDTLIANLNQNEDLLARVGCRSNAPVPEMMFAVCLANRRLAKIFAKLGSIPPAEADRKCRSIFEDKFRILQTDILSLLAGWNEGTSPSAPLPLIENRTALSGAVFLSANFCPVTEVLRQIDEWEKFGAWVVDPNNSAPVPLPPELPAEYSREALSAAARARMGADYLKEHAAPENLYLLNIYTWMLRDRFGDGDFEQLLPKGLRSRTVVFSAWDAHTNPFDFTHQSGDVPVDDNRILKQLVVYEEWDVWRGIAESRNRKLLASLRERLALKCRSGKGDAVLLRGVDRPRSGRGS